MNPPYFAIFFYLNSYLDLFSPSFLPEFSASFSLAYYRCILFHAVSHQTANIFKTVKHAIRPVLTMQDYSYTRVPSGRFVSSRHSSATQQVIHPSLSGGTEPTLSMTSCPGTVSGYRPISNPQSTALTSCYIELSPFSSRSASQKIPLIL